MKRNLATGGLIIMLALVVMLILVTATSCVTEVPPTPEPATSLEREMMHARWKAEAEANIAATNAEVEKLRLELEHNPNYIQAQSQARLTEDQADMMNRITEAREQMAADYQQMIQQRDTFALVMNDHIAVMKNTELFLRGYAQHMENIDHNTHGAAKNSYWTLLAFIPIGAVLFGLTMFCILMFVRLEKKIGSLSD